MDKIPSTFNFVPLLLFGKIGNNMVFNGVNIFLRLISLYICFQVNYEADIPSIIIAFLFPIVYIIYMLATKGGDYIVGLFGFDGGSWEGERCIEKQGARDNDLVAGDLPSIPEDRSACLGVVLGSDTTQTDCLSIKSVGSDELNLTEGIPACLYIPPDTDTGNTLGGVYREHYNCDLKSSESDCQGTKDENNQSLCQWKSFEGKTCNWGRTKLGWVDPTVGDLDWEASASYSGSTLKPNLDSYRDSGILDADKCPAGCNWGLHEEVGSCTEGASCTAEGTGSKKCVHTDKKVLPIAGSPGHALTVTGMSDGDENKTLEMVRKGGQTCDLTVNGETCTGIRTIRQALDNSAIEGCILSREGRATETSPLFDAGDADTVTAGSPAVTATHDGSSTGTLTLASSGSPAGADTWSGTITGCELVVHGTDGLCTQSRKCDPRDGSKYITKEHQLSDPQRPMGYCENK